MARRDKREEQQVAVGRIDALLAQARREAPARIELAHRYASLSLAVARKYQTGLARRQKEQVCRRCCAYLAPGRTSRIRLTRARISMTCLRCGHVVRRPIRQFKNQAALGGA